MNWNAIVERVAPSGVKIERRQGMAQAFFVFTNEIRRFLGLLRRVMLSVMRTSGSNRRPSRQK
jgi:hypothetical protein